MPNQDQLVVPGAETAIERFKYEVAQDVGVIPAGTSDPNAYAQALDRLKYEAAAGLGLLPQIQQVGWGNMKTRDTGAIGGRIGGKIGGQMVKHMIARAESALASGADLGRVR